MYRRNIKHDEVFSSTHPKVIEYGEKIFDAWNKQNGTDLLNALQDIQNLVYDPSIHTPTLKAMCIAYALEMVHQVTIRG